MHYKCKGSKPHLSGLQDSGLPQPLAEFAAADLAALRVGWRNVLDL